MRSDKPEAEPFIDWVTSDVLPSIRKTGQYQVQGFTVPQTMGEAFRLAGTQAAEIEFLIRHLQEV